MDAHGRKARVKPAKSGSARGARPAGGGRLADPAVGEGQGQLRSWEGSVESAALVGHPEPRADVFLAECAKVLSRSQLKARGALITVNGKEAKLSRILRPGDRVELRWREEPSPTLVPEDLPLSILYEDERCLVVDKAQGMVTHPGHGNRRGTLANAVLGLLARKSAGGAPAAEERLAAGGPSAAGPSAAVPSAEVPPAGRLPESSALPPPPSRAGIVHRLDKDTSGILIVAKDAGAQAFLAAQFKARTTRKEYLAIVRGTPSPEKGRISDRLGRDRRDRKKFAPCAEGGKPALTDYRVMRSWSDPAGAPRGGRAESYALVALHPRTGRTHQLRVHMAGLGTPILGDPIYGKRDPRFPEATLMLHAYRLAIVLPGMDEPRAFRAPAPGRMKRLLRELQGAFGEGRAGPG